MISVGQVETEDITNNIRPEIITTIITILTTKTTITIMGIIKKTTRTSNPVADIRTTTMIEDTTAPRSPTLWMMSTSLIIMATRDISNNKSTGTEKEDSWTKKNSTNTSRTSKKRDSLSKLYFRIFLIRPAIKMAPEISKSISSSPMTRTSRKYSMDWRILWNIWWLMYSETTSSRGFSIRVIILSLCLYLSLSLYLKRNKNYLYFLKKKTLLSLMKI